MSDVEPVKREAECRHSQRDSSLTLHGSDEIYFLEEVLYERLPTSFRWDSSVSRVHQNCGNVEQKNTLL